MEDSNGMPENGSREIKVQGDMAVREVESEVQSNFDEDVYAVYPDRVEVPPYCCTS